MKELFNAPEAEVIIFTEDIVTTSGIDTGIDMGEDGEGGEE